MSGAVLNWTGPFSFVHHASEVPAETLSSFGLYVLAIRYKGNYYAYNVGKAGGTDQSHRKFGARLGGKLPEVLKGKWYLYDPSETLKIGRLPDEPLDKAKPGFDPEESGRQWASILELFLAPCPDLEGPRIVEIEHAIQRHFKWLHRHQSVFARMYDPKEEPQSGPGPDSGDTPVHSFFEGAMIEGLTTVRV